jgi:dihydroxyacetone kinase-like predicted kinase
MREQRRELLTGGEAPVIAIVAVVSGHGMEQVYRSLGAHLIIPGGSTMNPSVEDIAEAISAAPSDQVILLPNNGNVIPGARHAISLSNKRVALVPTKAMTEGISALVVFSLEADLAANAEAMEEAAQEVRTLGVTYATRPIRWGDVHAETGQALAVRGDDVLAAGDDPLVVAETALRAFGLDTAELLTIYSGNDAPLEEAHRLLERLRQQFGGLTVELVEGGQPHYRYLFAIE